VSAEHDSRKRKRYFATSANQQEIFTELSANNKTGQDGFVNVVKGKTKKEKW
jgi:hypothetical protein